MLFPNTIPIVLISIDGLIPDYVLNADKYQLDIPCLRQLLREGSYASGGVKGVIPTLTYPSHATLITGVSPAIHGIINNERFDPFDLSKKHSGAWYYHAQEIKVSTLWDIARESGLVTASIDWPVSMGANIDYNIPQLWPVNYVTEDLKRLKAVSPIGLLDEVETAIGPLDFSWTVHGDQTKTHLTVFLMKQKQAQFVTVCLSALDTQQHIEGTHTKNVFTTLELIDKMVGKIRATAEEIGNGLAFVCVVSDHGFTSINKTIRLNAAFQQAGLITVNELGKIVSWRVFAWQAHGTAAVMLKDNNDNEAGQRAKVVLETLAAEPTNGIAQILNSHEAKEQGTFPNAVWVVGAQSDYRFVEDLVGPIITKENQYAATHGHFPNQSEQMDAAFFAVGPNIPVTQNLGRINLVDVAPTVTAWIGMELPTTEGRNILADKPSTLDKFNKTVDFTAYR